MAPTLEPLEDRSLPATLTGIDLGDGDWKDSGRSDAHRAAVGHAYGHDLKVGGDTSVSGQQQADAREDREQTGDEDFDEDGQNGKYGVVNKKETDKAGEQEKDSPGLVKKVLSHPAVLALLERLARLSPASDEVLTPASDSSQTGGTLIVKAPSLDVTLEVKSSSPAPSADDDVPVRPVPRADDTSAPPVANPLYTHKWVPDTSNTVVPINEVSHEEPIQEESRLPYEVSTYEEPRWSLEGDDPGVGTSSGSPVDSDAPRIGGFGVPAVAVPSSAGVSQSAGDLARVLPGMNLAGAPLAWLASAQELLQSGDVTQGSAGWLPGATAALGGGEKGSGGAMGPSGLADELFAEFSLAEPALELPREEELLAAEENALGLLVGGPARADILPQASSPLSVLATVTTDDETSRVGDQAEASPLAALYINPLGWGNRGLRDTTDLAQADGNAASEAEAEEADSSRRPVRRILGLVLVAFAGAGVAGRVQRKLCSDPGKLPSRTSRQ